MTQFEQIALHNAFMCSVIRDLDTVMDELRRIRRILVSGELASFELKRLLSMAQLELSGISQRIHNEFIEVQNRAELDPVIREAIEPFIPYVPDPMITDDGSDLKTEPKRRRKRGS